MATACPALRPIAEEPFVFAYRADIRIGNALGRHTDPYHLTAHGSPQINMAAVGHASVTVGFAEPVRNLGTHLEALGMDIRADVNVAFLRRTPSPAYRFNGLCGNASHRTAPSGMRNAEPAARSHHRNGKAVCKAKQDRNIGQRYGHGIYAGGQTLIGPIEIRIGSNVEHVGAMHLVGHEQTSITSTQDIEQMPAVEGNGIGIIMDMAAQIERGKGPFAHAPFARCESDAHAGGLPQTLVGKNGDTCSIGRTCSMASGHETTPGQTRKRQYGGRSHAD